MVGQAHRRLHEDRRRSRLGDQPHVGYHSRHRALSRAIVVQRPLLRVPDRRTGIVRSASVREFRRSSARAEHVWWGFEAWPQWRGQSFVPHSGVPTFSESPWARYLAYSRISPRTNAYSYEGSAPP